MNCPACTEKRLHGPEEWAYHPYAGHGFNGQGWTHPDLNPTQAVGDTGGFRLGDVFVSPAPLTEADIQSAQKLLKEHPEYAAQPAAIPPQTVGRTPEWREQIGYRP